MRITIDWRVAYGTASMERDYLDHQPYWRSRGAGLCGGIHGYDETVLSRGAHDFVQHDRGSGRTGGVDRAGPQTVTFGAV